MAPSALVGFHAAYISTYDESKETGMGNALVGVYLTELGLSVEAVMYLTVAAPNEMNWLTIEDAQQVGIDVKILEGEATATPSVITVDTPPSADESRTVESTAPLALADDYRWIVLASSLDLYSLPLRKSQETFGASAVTTVQSTNGNYALVIGPFKRADAEGRIERLRSMGSIAQDSYLSSGSRFVQRID